MKGTSLRGPHARDISSIACTNRGQLRHLVNRCKCMQVRTAEKPPGKPETILPESIRTHCVSDGVNATEADSTRDLPDHCPRGRADQSRQAVRDFLPFPNMR
jgi:hypothetical protein